MGLSSTLAASSHCCRWKSRGSPFKGETIDVVPSKDARPAVEYQNNVSEFTSSRRGALQKGEQKVTFPLDMPNFRPIISRMLHCPGNGAYVQALMKSTGFLEANSKFVML